MSRDQPVAEAPPGKAGAAPAMPGIAVRPPPQDQPPWAMEDPLEALLEMARKREIDPWNIDIIKVTDGFLARLEQAHRLNLRLSGRALLYASILLRMKSDALLGEEQAEQEAEPPPWDAEAHLPMEPRVLHPARRPATLYELIEELRRAERVKEQKAVRRAERSRRERERPSVEDAVGVAHEKHIRQDAEALWARLQQVFSGRDSISLSELVAQWGAGGAVEAYLCLLFLAQWRRVDLEQEALFGELLIRPGPGDASAAPREPGTAAGERAEAGGAGADRAAEGEDGGAR